ncbi:MAG: hypothetical protein J6Z12_01650, partial [Paludibacteraceae bacterium]|nr:hypothetical protein [Paludibacteraceae bacterium]
MKVIWQEDFGTVPAWTRYQYPRQDNTENWVVGHGFRDYGTRLLCPDDKAYWHDVEQWWGCDAVDMITAAEAGLSPTPREGTNPWYYGRGLSKIDDGDYAIISNSTYAEDGCAWVLDRTDHTGNPNGGFLLINVAPTEHDPITGELIPTQSIEKEINNVKFCSGVWYNFSIWASQLAKRNQLPSSFYLEAWGVDAGGNETLLGSITTGVMKNYQMDDWSHYGITFDPGDSKKVILKVFNMGEAGAGNDIVLDDLSLTVCYPDVELFADYSNLRHDADVLCGGTVHMGVVFDGEAARYFSAPAPYYLWQKCEWDAVNEVRTPWVSIPAGDPASGSGYHGDGEYGAGHTGHNFLDQDVAGTIDTTYYRVIMAGTKEIAEQIAADLAAGHDYTGCDVYNVSEIAKVSCFPCLKPDVAFTFEERTLCKSEAVGNFTQTATITFEKAEDFMNYYEWQKYVPDAAHKNTLDDPLEEYWTVLSSGGDKNGTTAYAEAVANLPYPQDSTLYRFLARNGRLGCDSTYVFKVFVKPNPVQPVLSTDPGCDQLVAFTVENYGADTTYTWTVNSATVTATSAYTVPSAVEGTSYLASVIATFDGCSSPAGTASQTYIITPDQPVVGTDPGCDKPVVFTVTNAAGYTNTYNWTVNGNSG